MKSITVSVEDDLIQAVNEQARSECTTIEELVHGWLNDYAQRRGQLAAFDDLTLELRGKVRFGKKLTRDELNER